MRRERRRCGTPTGNDDLPAAPAPRTDRDTDSDGLLDLRGQLSRQPNPAQSDSDGDFVGDACDNCLGLPNYDQACR